jgi:hypothetical protein
LSQIYLIIMSWINNLQRPKLTKVLKVAGKELDYLQVMPCKISGAISVTSVFLFARFSSLCFRFW